MFTMLTPLSKPFKYGNVRISALPFAIFVALTISQTAFAADPKDIELKGGDVLYDQNSTNDAINIALGKGAKALVGSGVQEALISFGEQFNVSFSKDASSLPNTIAIGTNAYARTGSIDVGGRTLTNQVIGDVVAQQTQRYGVAATTVGTNSYSGGMFANTFGSFNIHSSKASGNRNSDSAKNAFASIFGTFNSNESYSDSPDFSGIGNFIGGVGNKVTHSNGSLVIGGGNTINHSLDNLDTLQDAINPPITLSGIFALHSMDSPSKMQDTIIKEMQKASGGSALILGSGNQLDYAQLTQILGVQNKVTGTDSNPSRYNSISGTGNALSDTSRFYLSGNNNTVSETTKGILLGDNRVFNRANGSIAIGFSSGEKTDSKDDRLVTTVKDAVMIGNDAQVAQNGGVALGYKSVANTASGIVGYVPTSTSSSTAVTSRAAVAAVTSPDTSTSTWTSTAGAVSVGDVANNITRQITAVAAGTEDTDAVNVAQLKEALKAIGTTGGSGTVSLGGHAKVMAADNNIKVETKVDDQNGNTYSVSLNDKITLGDKADSQITIDGITGTVTMGEKVTLNGKTGGAKFGDTLTINNTNHTATVGKVTITGGETNTITNLANTTWNPNSIDRTRVATEGQLSDVYNEVHQQGEAIDHLAQGLTDVREDLKDVGAEAAAMAGLKPLQYDPLQPTQLMASVGNYRGSTALAIGVGHYVNERFMMHAGVSAASKHAMMNAGVSWKFGFDRKRMDEVPDRYKAGPISSVYVLQDEVTQLRAENDDLRHELRDLREMVNALVGTKSTK